MTNQIGNTSIGSVTNLEVGNTVDIDEYEILDEETSKLVSGERTGYNITIDFVVSSFDIIDTITLEEQKQRISKLIGRKSSFNSFYYLDFILGFISISEIIFSESSDRDTIIEGQIKGIYLPWPKYFSNLSRPSEDIRNYGSGFYGGGIYYGSSTGIYGNGIYGESIYN
jgi:hypothetical protein